LAILSDKNKGNDEAEEYEIGGTCSTNGKEQEAEEDGVQVMGAKERRKRLL
jgi:hypothetical protein